jgi:hypothetical protein
VAKSEKQPHKRLSNSALREVPISDIRKEILRRGIMIQPDISTISSDVLLRELLPRFDVACFCAETWDPHNIVPIKRYNYGRGAPVAQLGLLKSTTRMAEEGTIRWVMIEDEP